MGEEEIIKADLGPLTVRARFALGQPNQLHDGTRGRRRTSQMPFRQSDAGIGCRVGIVDDVNGAALPRDRRKIIDQFALALGLAVGFLGAFLLPP